MKRKTEKDYYILAEKLGIAWLGSTLPKDTHTATRWLCSKGHKFFARYSDLNRKDKNHTNCGCKLCAYILRRKTKEDYYALAESRQFKWIDENLPPNVSTKTLWRCDKGHEFETPYNTILQGCGCPYCAGNVKKTEKDYHDLAKSRGFKWVGPRLPVNVHKTTWWKCKDNHVFEANYNNVKTGWGCPQCSDMVNGSLVSKPQIKLNNLLCGSLNYPEGKYRIDVAIIRNSQKIAVEYDCCYWHKGNEGYDAMRDEYLIRCGWKIIHVKSRNLLPSRKQLKKTINKILNSKDVVNIFLEDWKV